MNSPTVPTKPVPLRCTCHSLNSHCIFHRDNSAPNYKEPGDMPRPRRKVKKTRVLDVVAFMEGGYTSDD